MELSKSPIRPKWARIVASILLVTVVAGAIILIWGMVRTGTEQPNYTMAIVVLTLAASIFLTMQIRVVARPGRNGLYVRNLIKHYEIPWEEIISVRFSADRPWAQLDVLYGDPVNVMAVQSADGPYAQRQAERLAAWVRTGEAREP